MLLDLIGSRSLAKESRRLRPHTRPLRARSPVGVIRVSYLRDLVLGQLASAFENYRGSGHPILRAYE